MFDTDNSELRKLHRLNVQITKYNNFVISPHNIYCNLLQKILRPKPKFPERIKHFHLCSINFAETLIFNTLKRSVSMVIKYWVKSEKHCSNVPMHGNVLYRAFCWLCFCYDYFADTIWHQKKPQKYRNTNILKCLCNEISPNVFLIALQR